MPHTATKAKCVARAGSSNLLVGAEGKQCRPSAVHVEGAAAAAAANGGFVRASRKPSKQSKPAVGRAYSKALLIGKGEAAAGSGRGRQHKLKHDEAKMDVTLELDW